jgi:hypothetical protein
MIDQKRKRYQGIVARVIVFEILKLPRRCEECGFVGRVEVHHINKDRDNNSRENVRILCKGCHIKLHDVILPKREPAFEEMITNMLPVTDHRLKYNSKKYIFREKRRIETQKYKDKWGIK